MNCTNFTGLKHVSARNTILSWIATSFSENWFHCYYIKKGKPHVVIPLGQTGGRIAKTAPFPDFFSVRCSSQIALLRSQRKHPSKLFISLSLLLFEDVITVRFIKRVLHKNHLMTKISVTPEPERNKQHCTNLQFGILLFSRERTTSAKLLLNHSDSSMFCCYQLEKFVSTTVCH